MTTTVQDRLLPLETAVRLTGEVVRRVRPEQHHLPTPCSAWDVQQLVEHLVEGATAFAEGAAGEGAAGTAPAGEDLCAAYDRATAAEVAAFAGPGALDRTYAFPFPDAPGDLVVRLHAMDVLVHGWDLAQATGQTFVVSDALADATLAFVRPIADSLHRGDPDDAFGPAQPAPEGSSSLERLVSFLGRRC